MLLCLCKLEKVGKIMKNFKKLAALILAVAGLFIITGCMGVDHVDGELADLMNKLYESIPEDERPMMLMQTEVDSETVEYFLGSTEIEFDKALASEPGVSSIAHSVVLVRTKENADIESVKTKIKENINPRKWMCVGVEPEDVIVENRGDLIILIMVEDEATREKIEEGFKNL